MGIQVPGAPTAPFRILSLDGGGAKGFYTLGVLAELRGMLASPLHEHFDLIYGTSTGSIIASLLTLGHDVDAIHEFYRSHVPVVTRCVTAGTRSAAMRDLTIEVFKDARFDKTLTRLGVVATRWISERPMIFKGNAEYAHARKGTFVPGFGVSIADAVQASCAAYPFFNRKIVTTSGGDQVELVDGGFCANNPTLYAIADALMGLRHAPENLRVVSVGVGVYPEPRRNIIFKSLAGRGIRGYTLLQKTLEINTQSMEQLRSILFGNVPTVRINDTFDRPEMATDLLEHDMKKLNLLRQRGRESFGSKEAQLKALFDQGTP